ncbi:MAG: 16S rRNA (guanine966-N2)-methyltransferase [Alphaproteobacteria bacterium]|jgi:16S rRNA (guanine966-N2)-methyltransferase
MAVKVISGYYGGRNLETPEARSDNSPVRPTKARVREAGFNMIFSRMDFADSKCFDLYCGSGAAGIEALSRGAEHVTFVDIDTKWAEKNINTCRVGSEQYKVKRGNVLSFHSHEKADLVLADPPYGEGLAEKTLENKDQFGKKGSLWLLEVESRLRLEPEKYGFDILKNKKYGKSTLWLLEQL